MRGHGRQETGRELLPPLSKGLATVPILFFAVIIVVFFVMDVKATYAPPLMLPIADTVFISVVPFAVAYVATASYMASGSLSSLLLGCGMLAWGCGSLAAGWLGGGLGGQSVTVMVHDVGALFGALFHSLSAALAAVGATSGKLPQRGGLKVALAYSGVLVVMTMLTVVSLQSAMPPYFIQGMGSTLPRRVMLAGAVALFVTSSLLFNRLHVRSGTHFLYWYSLALVLVAVGLSASFLQKPVGSAIEWAGRFAQYLGGVYFLIAVRRAIHDVRSRGLPLDKTIAGLFLDAEANYRALVETVPDAIVSTDPMGRVLLWNPAAERMFGYDQGEAVGSSLIDLIVPDKDAGRLREEMTGSGKSGARLFFERTGETQVQRKGGEVFPVELSVSVRETADGWVSTSVLRDITARKRAEEGLRKYTAELEARNEELDAFAHTVAHDLKGPLTNMIGFAQVLGDLDTFSRGQAHEWLRAVVENGQRMSNMIDELLLLSSVRQMVDVETISLDMGSIVEEALHRLSYQIEEHQVEIILPETWPAVIGYRPWVAQVWINYLSNAIKYGGHPPHVELGYSSAECGVRIADRFISTEESEFSNPKPEVGWVRFWVRDDGAGLTPAEQARLFTPFSRLDYVRVKGHGLGLSIVRRIVDRLGGEVGVKSAEGQGSEFSFSLPSALD